MLIIALFTGFTAAFAPQLADVTAAATASWQKGAAIFPNIIGDTATLQQSLTNLKATGADYVTFIIPYYQDTTTSSTFAPGADTPSDSELIAAINLAHSLGLKVLLTPHIETKVITWRALITASDRATWFSQYSAMLNHIGDIGKQTHAEGMCIGTELIQMATYTSNPANTQEWIKMIQSLRTHFPGYLTYGANWGAGFF